MEHAKEQGASERHACQLVHQPRGTQRYQPTQRNDEDALTRAIIALANQYGRYGYRRITILLQEAGWNVGKDRVDRIWRREGLKVPQKQKPRSRLWLNDGSCVRLRPERPNHVWAYDFLSGFTHDGRTVRFLNLIDEYTRECPAIHVGRRINSSQVIDVLADAMIEHRIPEHIRSDNGPEFVARQLRQWLAKTGAKSLYIEPGSPWENDYCESFNSKMRDEFLNGEIFYSMKEARVRNAGASTSTPSAHIPRRATSRQRRQHGRPKLPSGVEKWKEKNSSHFPTPPTTGAGSVKCLKPLSEHWPRNPALAVRLDAVRRLCLRTTLKKRTRRGGR